MEADDAPQLALPSWLWHLEIELSERNSLYFTWPAQSRYSSRLRWRALPAAEAALAANGAAGVPVRRPRRPTAVSAAFEADAGPDLSCGTALDEPPRPLIGEVSPLSVGSSVCRWVSRSSQVGGSIDRLHLPGLGPSVRPVDQGFENDRQQDFGCLGVCLCVVVGLRLCLCVSFGTILFASPIFEPPSCSVLSSSP